MNIDGHSALVTGSASGLGEAAARELARLGAKVAVLARNAAQAKKVAAEIGGAASFTFSASQPHEVAAPPLRAPAPGRTKRALQRPRRQGG